MVVRVDRRADDVAVGPTVGGHLGVLLHHDGGQVGGQQDGDQPGDEEHVDDIEPADELGPGELAAEQEERQVGPGDRDPFQDAPLNSSTSRATLMDLKVQYSRP